jgi:two-component system response regulator VicR
MKKKILVIDDDQTFRELISSGVDKDIYQVETAADGVEGLEHLEKAMPDLILLDIMMPRMNGVEFLEKMNEEHKHIPVIITSNDSSLDTISRGAELGVRGYIVKSNESMKTIMSSIERVFNEMEK